MKKSIALLIILTMVLSLTLTGCGQSADTPDSGTTSNDDSSADFDTGDSTIMDGTNNPDGDTEEASHEEEKQNENANADGTYTWQVGNYEITTHINVMDYIEGNVWHVNEMATALGWDKNSRSDSKKPMTFQMDDTYTQYINFSDSSDHCGAIMVYINGDRTPHSLVLPARSSDDYTFNDKDFTMSFGGIVAFAYACEQLSLNPSVDPFDGVFEYVGGSYNY